MEILALGYLCASRIWMPHNYGDERWMSHNALYALASYAVIFSLMFHSWSLTNNGVIAVAFPSMDHVNLDIFCS